MTTETRANPPAPREDGASRGRQPIVRLDDPDATEVTLTGGKASALARAAVAGMRTLPGVVLTTAFCADVDGGVPVPDHPAVHRVVELMAALLDGPAPSEASPVVVRSSSVDEDTADSSAAGQFESVLGVETHDQLVVAITAVLESRERAGAAHRPIAVLVQPMVDPSVAGILFGVDPVTGRSDRRVVNAVAGSPDQLVSGAVDGSHHLLDEHGTIVEEERGADTDLSGAQLRALVGLADHAASVFEGPQDIEWAFVDGDLVLLQSRPVTTQIRGVPGGPIYGPGPVAETFPERLRPLEEDLWIPPLRDGVEEALRLAASVPERDLDGPGLVIAVGGLAAIDLVRTGEIERPESRPPWYAVVTRIRRLRTAWRVGRLRAALPTLADRLIDRADGDLESLPALAGMTDRQLVAMLGRGRSVLRSLHAHEVLMGLLVDAGGNNLTGASVAMRVLAEARTDGSSDMEIVTHSPVVLALTPPRIDAQAELPPPATTSELLPGSGDEPTERAAPTDAGVTREALRLRVRWVQELTGRAAWELGRRMERADRLTERGLVRFLTYDELALLVTRRADVPYESLSQRADAFEADTPLPLPARFQLSDLGMPIAVRAGTESGGGTGAGGGVGTGPVTHDTDDPAEGSVLVVRTLAPGIGPLLPRLAGVVAETGSVLAHLAILAREGGVATVVDHAGAVDDFDEGEVIRVDGDTGVVERLTEDDEEVAS